MDSRASRLTHLGTLTLGTRLTTSMYWIRFCWVIMNLQEGRKGHLIVCSCNITGVLFSLLILFLFFSHFLAGLKLEITSNMPLVEVQLRRQSTVVFLSPWCWLSPYGYGVSSTERSLYFLCSLCQLMWWCLCRTALCRLRVHKARNICLVVISPYMLYMKWKLCGELKANIFSRIPNYCFLTISIYTYF